MHRKNDETPRNGNLLIVGTTASGKSSLAIELARRRPNVEIISIDSMAIYKGMNIGTATPTILEQEEIPHHLINIVEPSEEFALPLFQSAVEKALREIFRKAKTSSPCVIIFDELDSLARLKSGEESGVGETILSQLLTEMEEGSSSRVVVIGITNRPDMIDNAMLRSGRLDLRIFVPPPDEKGRLSIIEVLTENMPLSSDVNLKEIAVATQNYSGADLTALCREAAIEAMQGSLNKITSKNFALGMKRVKPSISKEVETWYEKMKDGVSNIVPQEMDNTFYG